LLRSIWVEDNRYGKGYTFTGSSPVDRHNKHTIADKTAKSASEWQHQHADKVRMNNTFRRNFYAYRQFISISTSAKKENYFAQKF
jgi:hypothetical protein